MRHSFSSLELGASTMWAYLKICRDKLHLKQLALSLEYLGGYQPQSRACGQNTKPWPHFPVVMTPAHLTDNRP